MSLFFFFPSPPFSSIHLLSSHAAGGEDGEARERDEIRHDRRKERQHDRNISRAAPDKRCCTRTLNTQHVNSSTSQYTHTHRHTAHCWIIHVASSNTEQTQQDPAHYSGSSPCLQWSTDCLCMCDAWSVCVLCVCMCACVCSQSGWHLMELWVSGGENEFKFSGELITITNPAVREQRPCYLKITFHLTLSWLF